MPDERGGFADAAAAAASAAAPGRGPFAGGGGGAPFDDLDGFEARARGEDAFGRTWWEFEKPRGDANPLAALAAAALLVAIPMLALSYLDQLIPTFPAAEPLVPINGGMSGIGQA